MELLTAENKNAKLSFIYDSKKNLVKETQNSYLVESQCGNDYGDSVKKTEFDGRKRIYLHHPGGLMKKVIRPDVK